MKELTIISFVLALICFATAMITSDYTFSIFGGVLLVYGWVLLGIKISKNKKK